MAKLIRTDGSVVEIYPDNGNDFKLKELKEYVKGNIEIVNLLNGYLLVVDENGKNKWEMNELATKVARNVLRRGDYISGDAVYVLSNQIK